MTSNEAKQFSLVLAYAAKAHEGQLRIGGEPYILHPIRVTLNVAKYVTSMIREETITIALLHDVLEDTPITLSELEHTWGMHIGHGVWGLTDCVSRGQMSMSETTRARRKEIDRAHILHFSPVVQLIKLLDVKDNLSTYPVNEAFLDIYLEEARLLAEQLLNAAEIMFSGIYNEFMEVFDKTSAARYTYKEKQAHGH